MKITVKVVVNARKEKIEESDSGFKVYVNAPAIEGRANKRLIEILSRHFNKNKSCFRILRGSKSREKIIQISEDYRTG